MIICSDGCFPTCVLSVVRLLQLVKALGPHYKVQIECISSGRRHLYLFLQRTTTSVSTGHCLSLIFSLTSLLIRAPMSLLSMSQFFPLILFLSSFESVLSLLTPSPPQISLQTDFHQQFLTQSEWILQSFSQLPAFQHLFLIQLFFLAGCEALHLLFHVQITASITIVFPVPSSLSLSLHPGISVPVCSSSPGRSAFCRLCFLNSAASSFSLPVRSRWEKQSFCAQSWTAAQYDIGLQLQGKSCSASVWNTFCNYRIFEKCNYRHLRLVY